MLLLDKSIVAIAHRIGSHPIEEAAPAVQEDRSVAIPLEDPRDGLDIIR